MEQNSPKKILILTTNPFPVGLAGTNRILSYCKGFLHYGYQPEVFCIRPTERYNNVLNTCVKGTFNDVNYAYPGGTTIRVASFWGRRKNDIFSKYAVLRLLYKNLRKGDVLFVIFYGNCISIEMFSIFFSKYFKKRIYKEESEHPEIYFRGNGIFFNSVTKWFFINKMYRYYNGIFVMTNPLRDFFLTKGIPDRKILVVPNTIDLERFEIGVYDTKMSLPNDYIAYLGPINQQKDGILTLVASFTEVAAQYPEMHLIIAGGGTQQEKNELSSLITQLHLAERVHYLGRISSNEIQSLFHGAKLLVSCRQKTFQNKYSFPTKVVEYLATGKPVVSTAPGDLSFYLKDRENAFIADKDDASTFATKILEALQDYDFALKVSQNGKELVKDEFNPIIQVKKIIDFYKE